MLSSQHLSAVVVVATTTTTNIGNNVTVSMLRCVHTRIFINSRMTVVAVAVPRVVTVATAEVHRVVQMAAAVVAAIVVRRVVQVVVVVVVVVAQTMIVIVRWCILNPRLLRLLPINKNMLKHHRSL